MKRGKTKQSKINLKNKTNKTLRVHSSNPEDPVLPGETHESAGILLSCRHKSFGSTFSRSMLAVRFIRRSAKQHWEGKGLLCRGYLRFPSVPGRLCLHGCPFTHHAAPPNQAHPWSPTDKQSSEENHCNLSLILECQANSQEQNGEEIICYQV